MICGHGGFILFSTMAMICFRGGSEYDPQALSYNFFTNYFSDLGYVQTYSGESNTISLILFAIAMCIIGITCIPFMFTFYRQFPIKTLERYIALLGGIIGIVSGLGYIGVGFTPMDQVEILHDLMTSIAFGGNMGAALFFAIAIFRSRIIPHKYGFLLLGVVLIISVFSVLQISLYGIETPFVRTLTATGQKVIVYLQLFLLFLVNIGISRVFREKKF